MTKENIEFELCGRCNTGKAVWCYLPGFSSGSNPHFCDECVPRGCECNQYSNRDEDYVPSGGFSPTEEDGKIKWISETIWTHIDDKGREYPCCEYIYDEEGFEK